ncbi:hypothetical protein D8911_11515 [Levilactobacillus brevis]|nr:hypothetical protein D8911_11515 [Levilactobacillus brevis]
MTKASTEKYWERRHLQVKAREIKNAEDYEKALQPELNGMYRELHAEMEKWYVKYANNQGMTRDEAVDDLAGVNSQNWGMTLERFERNAKKGRYPDRLDKEYYRSRVARLQDLEQQLRQVAQPYASRETDRMRNGLAKQFDDTYMRTNYNVQASKGAFTANFAHFNEAQLKMVVSNPWGKDGKDFSKRIWKNYQQDLPKMLRDSVLTSTLMGYGPRKASQLFHAKFRGFKKSNVHRLVTSEMGHIAEEAAAQGYEENEIERYEYMATLESHTCDTCGRLDGRKFKLAERKDGINYPLIHPYCRCTTVPYIDDLPDITERWSRDPETGKGKMVKDVKFDEWKKLVVQNTIPLGPLVNTQIQDKLNNAEAVTDLENILSATPKNIKKMWQKYSNDMKLDTINDDGESFYLPTEKSVKLDKGALYAAGKDKVRNKYDLYFHEFGHAIDDLASHGSINISENVKYGFKSALNNDFANYLEKLENEMVKNIAISDLEDVHELQFDPTTSAGTYQGERVTFSSKANALTGSDIKNVVIKSLKERRSEFEFKESEFSEEGLKKNREFGDVSDMINAATGGDVWITMGHGKDYYKRDVGQVHEAFAEMTSASINNPASLKKIKEYFPSAYNVYLKMVDDIANGGV